MLELEAVVRLTRDIKNASASLSPNEARYLVDAYYTIQEYRKSTANQTRALSEANEPNDVIKWLFKQHETLEGQVKRALDAWSDSKELGRWAKSIVGIGPVISAGLLAHIDIAKAPTVGHIWRFAGLDPTMSWKKGEKRPWNASLKTLCWLVGESFVKVCNHPEDVYGKLYQQRKQLEESRNNDGTFADQAAAKLEKFKIGKSTDAYAAYSTGKLPPAHIHARAKRYAVKLFLAHYQHVGYRLMFGVDPPKPFAIAQLGHAHYIAPPNFPQEIYAK